MWRRARARWSCRRRPSCWTCLGRAASTLWSTPASRCARPPVQPFVEVLRLRLSGPRSIGFVVDAGVIVRPPACATSCLGAAVVLLRPRGINFVVDAGVTVRPPACGVACLGAGFARASVRPARLPICKRWFRACNLWCEQCAQNLPQVPASWQCMCLKAGSRWHLLADHGLQAAWAPCAKVMRCPAQAAEGSTIIDLLSRPFHASQAAWFQVLVPKW